MGIGVMDFKDIAEKLNYNFVKTAHLSQWTSLYTELADKLGIIIDEESTCIKTRNSLQRFRSSK